MHAVTEQSMELNEVALSPSMTTMLPSTEPQTSTQSCKGAQRMGATFERQ